MLAMSKTSFPILIIILQKTYLCMYTVHMVHVLVPMYDIFDHALFTVVVWEFVFFAENQQSCQSNYNSPLFLCQVKIFSVFPNTGGFNENK